MVIETCDDPNLAQGGAAKMTHEKLHLLIKMEILILHMIILQVWAGSQVMLSILKLVKD